MGKTDVSHVKVIFVCFWKLTLASIKTAASFAKTLSIGSVAGAFQWCGYSNPN
jgi:hypothetical protein